MQCTCCTVPTTSGKPLGRPLVWACQWPSLQPLSFLQLSHNDSLWAQGITISHREQGLDYREAEELTWCPSCIAIGELFGWKCHWPDLKSAGFFRRISSWTPLKPKHNNAKANPNLLAHHLWCIDFLTPPTPLIIPHRLPAFLESLMPLKNTCSIHARWSKSSLKHSIRFCGIFSKFKAEFYCISFF